MAIWESVPEAYILVRGAITLPYLTLSSCSQGVDLPVAHSLSEVCYTCSRRYIFSVLILDTFNTEYIESTCIPSCVATYMN
eukprot:5597875-Pleurochrysis_carterae.AAC.3